MRQSERWTRLLDILSDRGRVDVAEAAQLLQVSAATVRRDLEELARQQLLTRTYGGAVLAGVSYDLPLRYKAARRADEKARIARAAAALVPPGSVVGLTGGTTTSEVARELAVRTDLAGAVGGVALTVVTNAIDIAGEFAVRPHIKTVMTGGVVRPASYELTGPLAAAVLDDISLDLAVLGVNALDAVVGASTADESEAGVNRAMARRAATVVVVADSTKLGRRAFATVCRPQDIDVLVTDTGAPEVLLRELGDLGVEVHRV